MGTNNSAWTENAYFRSFAPIYFNYIRRSFERKKNNLYTGVLSDRLLLKKFKINFVLQLCLNSISDLLDDISSFKMIVYQLFKDNSRGLYTISSKILTVPIYRNSIKILPEWKFTGVNDLLLLRVKIHKKDPAIGTTSLT